ncbi:MAG: hypothetical protein ABJJ53_14240 [Sulfitobacter sp.]
MEKSSRQTVRTRIIESQHEILTRMHEDAKQLLSVTQYLESTAGNQ